MASVSRYGRRWILRLLPVLLLLFPIYGQVNLSAAAPDRQGTSWCVAGTFQGWDNSATPISDDGLGADVAAGDGILTFEYTFPSAGINEFKFVECGSWISPTDGNLYANTAAPDTTIVATLDTVTTHIDGGYPSSNVTHVSGDVEATSFTAVGDWQGWNNTASAGTALTDLGGGIFEGTFTVGTPGTYLAKVVETDFWRGFDAQGRTAGTPANASFTTTIVDENVFFRVDTNTDRMFIFAETSPPPSPWCVAGTFQGWNNGSTAVYDDGYGGDAVAGDGIYTFQYTFPTAGINEFKFIQCNTWNGPTVGNLWAETAAPDTTIVATLDTATVYGDGGYPSTNVTLVTGDIDPTTFTAVGDWQGWANANPATALSDLGGGIYEGTFTIGTAGTYEAKVVITGSWDGFDAQGRTRGTPSNAGFTTIDDDEEVTFRVNTNTDRMFITTSSTPPATWDSMYHSSCSSYFTTDCGSGDHAAAQQVPGQSIGTTFSSVRVAGSPVGTTDVFVYDDESVTMYALADTGQFVDDTDYPRVRYWNGTAESFANMDTVGTFAGDFNGRNSSYDVFSGTLPPVSPRTIYYWVTMRYGTTNLGLCRGGNPLNDVNQAVAPGNNCSFNDYAFDILDDDTSGPDVSNLSFSDGGDGLGNGNDQVCADVIETGTDSGDNDSAVGVIELVYTNQLGDLVIGNGIRATMTLSGGNTYCASGLSFSDPMYYRVEAQNDDQDHPTTQDYTDIDTTSSAPTCAGATCDLGSTDNNIQHFELLHDTRDTYYRAPFGAVPTGSTVTIRFRTAQDDVQFVYLRVFNGANGPNAYNMAKVSSDGTYDYFEATITASDTATPRQLYYKFQLIDGTDEDWYVDNHRHNEYDHEDRYENGTGITIEDGNDPTYADNSFTMTVYDSSFDSTVDSWVQNAVIYQIMPDRFRNGDPSNDTAWPGGYDVYGNTPFTHTTWNEAPVNPRAPGPYLNFWSADFFGGDLQGITDELDYLQSLGVTAIYLNPVFSSPSNHGYDTTDYYNINPRYGDNAMFQLFAAEAEERGINIILDGVFNHSGSDSVYFDRYNRWDANGNPVSGSDGSGACEGASSPYSTFYNLIDDGTGPCYGDRNYESWFGYDSLPLLIDYIANNAVRDFVFDVDNDNDNGINALPGIIQFWYDLGADGWRFDVANEIPHDWWQQFRNQVKINDGYYGPLITEVWYEAQPWLLGNELDSTMNYRYRKAVLGFLVDSDFTDNDANGEQTILALSPSQFDYVLNSIREDYPAIAWQSMMNLMGSHDTNRALFVLSERSVNLTTAFKKLEMMAALQFTYPGAPTIYYGDEAGLGSADYGGYGNWGAGYTADGILQDDPYNRHTYPWNPDDQNDYDSWTGSGTYDFDSVTGPVPPTDPYADDLLSYYSLLGTTRNSYPVLRTGDVVTLLTDDTNNVYAYARTDGSTCAIAIFNRSGSTRNVTLSNLPARCQAITFYDVLNNGTAWNSTTSLTVNNIPSLSSAVLVPALGVNNLRLPPAAVNVTSNNANAEYINQRTISATVTDLTGNPVPAGVSVQFSVISGNGTLSSGTATTNGSGVATVTYNAPNLHTVAVIEASLVGTNNVTYRGTTTIYVHFGATVIDSHSQNTTIGPDFVDGFAEGLSVAATKIGTGEPVVSLAQFDGNPYDGSGSVASPFVDVNLSDTTDVDMLAIQVQYTDETDEANHGLYWWDGSGWAAVTGYTTVDTANNRVVFEATASSSPRLDQLTDTVFVVNDPGFYVPPANNAFLIGDWQATIDGNAEGGQFLCTSDTFGAMIIGFTGPSFDIIHVEEAGLGEYNIEIDGGWVRTVNTVGGSRDFATETVDSLSNGYHIARIVRQTGTICIDTFNMEYDASVAPEYINIMTTTNNTVLGSTAARADCRIDRNVVFSNFMMDASTASYELSVVMLANDEVAYSDRFTFPSLGFGLNLRVGMTYNSGNWIPVPNYIRTFSGDLPVDTQMLIQTRQSGYRCQSIAIDYDCTTGQAAIIQSSNICIFP